MSSLCERALCVTLQIDPANDTTPPSALDEKSSEVTLDGYPDIHGIVHRWHTWSSSVVIISASARYVHLAEGPAVSKHTLDLVRMVELDGGPWKLLLTRGSCVVTHAGHARDGGHSLRHLCICHAGRI